MFHVKKTNRYFSTQQGVTNHLRLIYDNSEEAYISENEITEIPKCKYCNNNCKFTSFFQGYYFRCNSPECVKQSKLETYDRNLERRLENKNIRSKSEIVHTFKEFLVKNIDFYHENFDISNINEPFFNVNVGNKSLYSFLRRKFTQDIFIENRVCKFCDCSFSMNIIRERFEKHNCNSKECRNLEDIGYNNSDIVFKTTRELNNFTLENKLHWLDVRKNSKNFKIWKDIYHVPNYNQVRLFRCPLTDWIIPLSNNSNTLLRFLRKNKFNKIEYFEKFLPEQFIVCKECGTKKLNRVSGNSTVIATFCSKKCFNSFRKNNPELYLYSEKTRQQQSETMKEKIASGEFTPCITNTWTRWDAKVELEDGTVKKFRSSWEACFWFCNQHLEYEKVRIPYSIDGTWKNYIVDFVDTEQKILYEIKPNSVKDNESNVLKSEAAKEWCKVNNYSYSMITDEWFIENVKVVDFKNNTGILEKMRQFLVK